MCICFLHLYGYAMSGSGKEQRELDIATLPDTPYGSINGNSIPDTSIKQKGVHTMDTKHYNSFSRALKRVLIPAMLGLFALTVLPHFSWATDGKEEKILIVYFSMPETSNPTGMTPEEENSTVVINGEVLGNTQYIANLIQEMTGGDIFRIEPLTPYTTDHRALVDLAKEEQNTNARPAVAGKVENMDAYTTIFIGYPNWWADMPMIMYTFIESYDLSGKTIIPFNTHGGSRFSNTIRTIANLQPQAQVIENGFTIYRSDMEQAQQQVQEWLTGLGYKK